MKLKIYYHLNDSPGWNDVMSDQMTKMSESGLLDQISEAHFCTNGDELAFQPAQLLLKDFEEIKWHHTSNDRALWEWPTLDNMRQHVTAMGDEEFYVMYVHLKGLSRPSDPAVTDWRLFMDYWIIERWQDCVAKLDEGYDTAGVNFAEQPWPHYSGNFWWARASYLRRLPELVHPAQTAWGTPSPYTGARYDVGNFRYDHEAWIGSSNPRAAELFVSPGKQDTGWHFRNNYPRENYAAG